LEGGVTILNRTFQTKEELVRAIKETLETPEMKAVAEELSRRPSLRTMRLYRNYLDCKDSD